MSRGVYKPDNLEKCRTDIGPEIYDQYVVELFEVAGLEPEDGYLLDFGAMDSETREKVTDDLYTRVLGALEDDPTAETQQRLEESLKGTGREDGRLWEVIADNVIRPALTEHHKSMCRERGGGFWGAKLRRIYQLDEDGAPRTKTTYAPSQLDYYI